MRGLGANAIAAMAFNSAAYGGIPTSGYMKIPFVPTFDLGEAQALIPSDLLGFGRDPQDPTPDVVDNRGSKVWPVDTRYSGLHLKALFGDPTTEQGVAATGSYTFSAQPADNAVITVGGQAFTFVSGTPAANQIKIGATLADTVVNAVLALNASAVAGVAVASYAADLTLTKILITYDALGTGGNAMTITAGSSPASNATASGATLAGGSASGPYRHIFQSGASALPDYAIELGHPEVPSFHMNYGCVDNSVTIPLSRSGLLNATTQVIAQGESPTTTTTAAGSPTEWPVTRFANMSGFIERDGVPLGDIQSGEFSFSNGLDPVETIRPDGRIAGVDPGDVTAGLKASVRYKSATLRDLATNNTPITARVGWSRSPTESLTIEFARLFLPRPKKPVTSRGAVMEDYDMIAAKGAAQAAVRVILVNDVSAY